LPEVIVGKQKKPLLLKGSYSDLMEVDPSTGEARFSYRKAKHFEELKPEPKPVSTYKEKPKAEKADPLLRFLRGR